jgi:hypothetical protein
LDAGVKDIQIVGATMEQVLLRAFDQRSPIGTRIS